MYIKQFSLFTFIVILSVSNCEDSDATKFMKHLQVIPDVIPVGPKDFLKISYDSGVQADKGVELTPTQVKNQPKIDWPADKKSFYTIIKTDPDAPSRKEPMLREFLHWLVVNIPGNDIETGDIIAEYIGAGPPEGTDLHRYVYLLYKQPKKLEYDEVRIPNTSSKNRPKFSTKKFVEKYNLGIPIAGNFYQAQYDDYVPTLHKQLAN